MSDLISRSDVINLLCILHIDNITVNGKRVTEYIRELPTAYDIEKVVAELEEERQRLRNLKNDCIALSDSEVIAIEENAYNFAIDIVRKGGVND